MFNRTLAVLGSLLLTGLLLVDSSAEAASMTITVASPASGAVPVKAITSKSGVTVLVIKNDGAELGRCSARSCVVSWDSRNVTNGSHTISAIGLDSRKRTLVSASKNVQVNNDLTPPYVALSAPASASGSVTLSAAASDAGGVAAVQLLIDGTPLAAASLISPAQPSVSTNYTWDATTATTGSHTVQAFATDKAGNMGSSIPVTVVVVGPVALSTGKPELPRTVVDTTLMPSMGQVISVGIGGDFQSALNSAQLGDVIELSAGAVFSGQFTLPTKSGTGWITIRTAAVGSLPPPGTRVTPAQAALMPVLESSSGTIISTAPGAHHYRFIGVEIRPTPGAYLYNLVLLGLNETALSDQPHHIIFDRSYLHGDPVKGTRRGVAMNGSHMAVIDSYLADFKEVGADSQALMGWNGPGPIKIVNNYLEGAGENVLFGGADPSISQLVPSDIEIRRNDMSKPLSWKIGDPSYGGTPWTVKNLLELKNARRVLIEGNRFQYNWAHAQSGFAILFTVRNQNGTAPWSVVEDITFTNNLVRHSGQGINILGTDNDYPSQLTTRILIRNNLFDDLTATSWGGDGRFIQLLQGATDVTVDHNTAFQSSTAVFAEGAPMMGFAFTNNLLPHNAYGVIGTGTGVGQSTLTTYFPDAVFERNVLMTADSSISSLYPAGFLFPSSWDAVGFIDFAGGDYRLALTSPYKGAGIDGADIGVEWVEWSQALGGLSL